MKKKYVSDLANLYSSQVINENENNKVWKTGDCPDALGDSPHAESGLKPDGSGPASIEGVKEPLDNQEEEGISNDSVTQNVKKPQKKEENLSERNINNSTMSKPNIFDKLYATIMEAEDLDDENFDLGGMEDETSDLDELGVDDEGGAGDEVTVTLSAEEADLLRSIVDKIGGGEDELDDLGGEEDDLDFGDDSMEGDDPLMEKGDAAAPSTAGQENGGKPTKHTGVMPHGKPGDNKVGGEGVRPKGGSASGDAAGEENGGKPSKHTGVMPHGTPGDNKVGDYAAGSNFIK